MAMQEDMSALSDLLRASIVVKPHPPNTQVRPKVLLPVMLLPREHLPLGCIDFSPSDEVFPNKQLCESHVKILDLEGRLSAAPSVLVVRNETKRWLYALEKQGTGLYVICRLGPWVKLDVLASKATASLPDRLRLAASAICEGNNAPLTLTTPQIHKAQKQKRAAIEAIQSLVRKRARSQYVTAVDFAPGGATTDALETNQSKTTGTLQSEGLAETPQVSGTSCADPIVPTDASIDYGQELTAKNVFDNIHTQYFTALYKSMGSLAYFAKGALSRARSAFHLNLESTLEMSELVEFLKSLILTTVQIDKKYRETIPDLLSRTHAFAMSPSGERVKSNGQKTKRGKNGLYPAETECIRTWWMSHKPELRDEQGGLRPSQIKSQIALLRTRETQLQIILILEILALETLRPVGETDENSLPPLPGMTSSQLVEQPPSTPPAPKKRNKHNLPVLVDVHADRLNIWQSTASDEQLLLEDSQGAYDCQSRSQQKASSEPLRDFCKDIIIPFFSARLPKLCDAISRKLGGPIIISRKESTTSEHRSAKQRESKPGTKSQRPALQNPRRTLQHALSTDQQHQRSGSKGPGNAIALMRSATSMNIPTLKREGSEAPSLDSLPQKGTSQPEQRQSNLVRSISFSSLHDYKEDKKARVEAELKEAISALRKPNRSVVQQAMTEADERRLLARSATKKAKKPPRSSQATAVQVKATPANYRFKDALAAHPADTATPLIERPEDTVPPSSVVRSMPSSASQRNPAEGLLGSSSTAVDFIGSTPLKTSISQLSTAGPAKLKPDAVPSSPLMKRSEKFLRKSCPPRSLGLDTFLHSTPQENPASAFTPKSLTRLGESGMVHRRSAPLRDITSIYQQLGWDDDFGDVT